MNSGIYKITFSNGSFYIGKSSNIDKRWSQHSKAMLKGTHTKSIQEAYRLYGEPVFEILYKCHQDHIDILEGYFINELWASNILNTTRPTLLSDEDIKVIKTYEGNIWTTSTFDHLRGILDRERSITSLNSQLLNTRNGKRVKELENKNNRLAHEVSILTAEISKLKDKGFFERLFNL